MRSEWFMLSKAAVIHNKGDKYVIETIEVASPKVNEVMVKIAGCGLCHTDELAQHQMIPVPLPAVLGHEGSGVVVEVGPGVEELMSGTTLCCPTVPVVIAKPA